MVSDLLRTQTVHQQDLAKKKKRQTPSFHKRAICLETKHGLALCIIERGHLTDIETEHHRNSPGACWQTGWII